MSTVPIFAPDGTLGDVPYERMMDAIRAGGKPGVTVKAPDGSTGVIPAHRIPDAVKAGATIVPMQEQETQHPGFWSTISGDLSGLLHPSGFSPYPGMDTEAKSAAAGQSYTQDQARQAAGYSPAYRALVPFAQSVGTNVPGMEQSAASGDVGGVLGHAAAPVTMIGAGEAVRYGAGPAADAAAPAVRATARGINTGLAKAPGTIGGTVGAGIGGYLGGHVGAEVGGVAGAVAGRELLPQVRVPGEGFGFPNRVQGGPQVAPQFAPTPASAEPAVGSPAPNVLPNPSPEAAATIPRTLSGEAALADVLSRMDNASLLKIARSRGINVAQESLLKAGSANAKLIAKITADFSPDELDEFRSQYLENTRLPGHQFGQNMTDEAWSTVAKQTYFPDVAIPKTVQTRTAAAMANMPPRTRKGLGL